MILPVLSINPHKSSCSIAAISSENLIADVTSSIFPSSTTPGAFAYILVAFVIKNYSAQDTN